MARGWATLGELALMPRQHALDALDILDALEEAEDEPPAETTPGRARR